MIRILLALVIAALEPLATARAQGDQAAYCRQLSDLYRRYVQNSPGRRADIEALNALENCSKGNTREGVPVLEKKLRESRITLPAGGEFKP